MNLNMARKFLAEGVDGTVVGIWCGLAADAQASSI
jgi:hypothetical protein